jgi:hypothetical protein
MAIKVVVEFQAKPGERSKLKSLLQDAPDGLVEIADWESAEAQAAAVEQASAAGVYAPVVELVAAPIKATRIVHLP